MNSDFAIVSLKTNLKRGEAGELYIKKLLAGYTCFINPDVERFLLKQSVDFTKRNQSVTYLVISRTDKRVVGYFTLAIKPISVNAKDFSNTIRRKIERVSEVNEQTGEYILAAYLIAQLGKNFKDGINERITGEELLRLALAKIHQLQDMAGGTVVFLETDNAQKLIAFYEQNGFKRFATRKSRGTQEQHKLVQMLKVI